MGTRTIWGIYEVSHGDSNHASIPHRCKWFANKHIILPMTCDAEFRVCSALGGDGRWWSGEAGQTGKGDGGVRGSGRWWEVTPWVRRLLFLSFFWFSGSPFFTSFSPFFTFFFTFCSPFSLNMLQKREKKVRTEGIQFHAGLKCVTFLLHGFSRSWNKHIDIARACGIFCTYPRQSQKDLWAAMFRTYSQYIHNLPRFKLNQNPQWTLNQRLVNPKTNLPLKKTKQTLN